MAPVPAPQTPHLLPSPLFRRVRPLFYRASIVSQVCHHALQNRARAVSLLEEADAKGQLVALVKLGGIYQAGGLVKVDSGKAAAYYKRAIASGRLYTLAEA